MLVYLASPNILEDGAIMEWFVLHHGTSAYRVSSVGVVRNLRDSDDLRPYLNNKGYRCLKISTGGLKRHYLVHRLVAELFVPNPDGLPEVNHKDGDKGNNVASNLEWCSRLENVSHAVENGLNCSGHRHGGAKLSPESVVSMREECAAGASLTELAAKYGVTFGRVGAIVRGESWKAYGGPITKRGMGYRDLSR